MPIQTQGSLATFSLDVRNGSGDYTDPSNLSFAFRDSLGVNLPGFPVTYPGQIVKDNTGRYHYLWTIPLLQSIGNYTAIWAGILLGAPTGAQEQWEIVPAGSMTTSGLDILVKPTDYDAIRGLLGVTTLDVEDKDIELIAFGPEAELRVKRRVANWSTQIADPETLFVLRVATAYQTACLMARSWVHGGTIGLVRPLSTGEGRDWAAAADQFCASYQYWIDVADESDADGHANTDYRIRPIVRSGPTSMLIARRRSGFMTSDPDIARWWSFPPFWRY